jgi:hypothetical protein
MRADMMCEHDPLVVIYRYQVQTHVHVIVADTPGKHNTALNANGLFTLYLTSGNAMRY